MRKLILIAGFALVSAAAQAGDRSLSLAGSQSATVALPAKPAEAPRTAEAPPATEAPTAEAPKYVERPAVVEPKTAATKSVTRKTQSARIQSAKLEQSAAERARPVARRTASSSRTERPHRKRHWAEARIIRELHRHGIYW